jgi:hypothetical protein
MTKPRATRKVRTEPASAAVLEPQTEVKGRVKARPSRTAIKPADFGLAAHKFQALSATVSERVTAKDLEDPKFWSLVAHKMTPGAEIRVLAADCSFRAEVLCTYAMGTEVRVIVLDFLDLEQIDYEALDAQVSGYEIKQRGVEKWCIIKVETGEVVKSGIPTQAIAARELEDHKRALAA